MSELAEHWRRARRPVAGVHLDSAACSRQSLAAIDAAAQHARHEAEVGGYVAGEAAGPALAAGRAAVAALAGIADAEVVFTTGSSDALDLLLSAWPGQRVLACLPGEFGPNLAVFAANGFEVVVLPVDGDGRLLVQPAATLLASRRPALVHLTAVGSHRGILQPLAEAAQLCRELDLPLVIDAAQALGHVDCAVDADALYSSSRKWMAGPRGVGALAVRRTLLDRLQPRVPPPEWNVPMSVASRLEMGEANIAARLGYSIALGEHLAAGAPNVRAALAEIGRATRKAVATVPAWRVVEPLDEPTAITTLAPAYGVDPLAVRNWLIAERGIVTTYIGVERAPFEIVGPVLRVSPHVDATADDLTLFAEALTEATVAAGREQR